MKRFISFVVALFLATTALWAYDFQSGDLYYNITSRTEPYTVEVTYQQKLSSNNYEGLTSVTIPATVINNDTTYSVTSIGSTAFYGCTGLTSITIPNSVTSIGSAAFYGCTGLTSITIPNSVTSIESRAFAECSTLTDITVPNSVTLIGVGAFLGCSGLSSITIPNSVTKIKNFAFNGCSGLTAITIPSSVTSIGMYVFTGCKGLTSMVVESGNTVYDSRENCNAIINTATNTLLYGCKTTVIPNSVTSIANNAFDGHSALTDISIPNSITSIGEYAFANCTGLTSITIPNSVTSIGEYTFGYCTGLTSITIPNSVTSIGEEAFRGCTGLTSVTIPNSVTSIGVSAFFGCTGLTSITIPNSVTSIGYYAFDNVANIVYNGTAKGSPWGARSVNGYVEGYLVYADANKTTLLACYTTATGAITIPNSVTSIGDDAFYSCTGLTSITIPNSVTSIGFGAFSSCKGLTSITIPNSVTSIGNYAFSSCKGLTSITIPNSVTSIGFGAFSSCKGLTSITIPNSVTSIGEMAFVGCTGLTAITIPNSVTSIGGYAFYGCTGLTSITILAETPPTIQANTFENTSLNTIYIPCGTKDAYQAAANWSRFTNYIETPPYFLLVTPQDEAMGSVRISQEATCTNNTATFEAIPNTNYRFKQWSDGNTDNPRTITLDDNMSFVAQFESAPTALDPTRIDNNTAAQKMMRNGQVYILRGNKTYTTTCTVQ